ncbi:MAG TPA: SHOCT domain-containing protein [Candidatus Limnocylindria bacterium]|nr:SHOCT domain-containing protein [Candidatus Limnocylindria bacterium]
MTSLPRALLALAVAFSFACWTLLAASFAARVPEAWGVRGANSVLGLTFAWTGSVVATRQRRNPVGWLLLALGTAAAFDSAALEYASYALYGPGGTLDGRVAAWVHEWMWPAYLGLIVAAFLLFPNGRLLSQRWRPLLAFVAGAAAIASVLLALTPGPMSTFGIDNPFGVEALPSGAGGIRTSGLVGVVLAAIVVAGVAAGVSLVLRFRASRADTRQQIKWLATSAVFMFVVFPVSLLSPSAKAGQALVLASFLTVPVAIAIAITRYRLYEINTIINRALVYGGVTALLAGAFAAVQEMLKRVFVSATGANSELSVVFGLFLIATLFAPARAWLQKAVDARFRSSGAHPDGVALPAAQALRDIARLHAEGVLTDSEFAAKMAELLARI